MIARTLADANTGYLLNVKMYYEKDDNEPISGPTKISTAIVDRLQPYTGQGYDVFL